MWFTRVSLKNPVFATMVMLALVVLGLFSLQRLQVVLDAPPPWLARLLGVEAKSLARFAETVED